ncbi:RAMP superfamily CRISPR-associated protein [Skermania piniformis]|uniref:CRISPR type III-associated protein domain-containing protein n=1 Tax=Skermania pinensis TaxID=39122 RepID=A0ABX8S9Q5_9ACTN|nr:RAMP superfamily CRISPR-associated protein [Skermania piniformis]QXQ14503.1 hypothetical protein KV203_03600 [Skermania piniformis]
MPDLTFDITITFRSDWHIGTGTGQHGSVDRVIVTDEIGLPYVPAKTAVGMLRDGAEIAASALDNSRPVNTQPGIWARWVRAIFGDQPSIAEPDGAPRPATLVAAPLRLVGRGPIAAAAETPAAGAVLRRADLVAATKTLRAGVRIDPASGVAKEDMFRIEERARAGLAVRAAWRVEHPDGAETWPAELLLLAAATITRQIGGKRRRGAGRGDIELTGMADLAELTVKATGAVPKPWPATTPDPAALTRGGSASSRPLRHAHDLIVTVRRPLIIDNGQRGNVVETATSVPGTMLLAQLRPDLPNLADLIRAGEVVVTDATIDIDGVRGLPWPRALAITKDAPAPAEPGDPIDYVNVVLPHRENPRLKPKPKRYLDPTCTRWRTVDVVQGVHASIDDTRQRPTEQTGGLFVYSGIAAGTVLRAQVYLPDGVTLEPASREVRLGRSSKDDYGRATVEIASPATGTTPKRIDANTKFAVWLTADLLLRDERGAPDTRASAFVASLAQALGVPGRLRLADTTDRQAPGEPFADVSDNAVTGLARRQGWQRGWGLPRPSLTGMGAGSVVRVVTEVDLTPAMISSVERSGIGDRTAEGFGRLWLAPPALGNAIVSIGEYQPPPPSTAPTNFPVDTALRRAAWRKTIERTAVHAAAATDPKTYFGSTVTRTQRGNLRGVLNRIDDRDGVRAWLAGPKRASVWGGDQLTRLGRLLDTEPTNPEHPVWPILFGPVPTDLDDAIRTHLAHYAVQLYLTEVIRIANLREANS